MTLEAELLAHQIATIKRGAGLGRDVAPFLEIMRNLIKRRVERFDEEKRTNKRLEKMLDSLAAELEKPAGEFSAHLREELKAFARYEITYEADTLTEYTGVNFVAPTVEQVWAAAKFNPLTLQNSPVDFDRLIDQWGANEVARLVTGVKTGFTQGLTTREIVGRVIGQGGLIGISRQHAEAVAATAISHVATSARFATFEENADIVTGYQYVATLDSRTTLICRSLDGNRYKFDQKGAPHPPMHYRCRSTIKPTMIKEFDFLDTGATRSSASGSVDANETYYEWLKKQPKAYQDEALGKTKADIFRNAGISEKDFKALVMDDFGRPLTLEQMAARDKRVAAYLRKKKEDSNT